MYLEMCKGKMRSEVFEYPEQRKYSVIENYGGKLCKWNEHLNKIKS